MFDIIQKTCLLD